MGTFYFISDDGEGYARLDNVQDESDWSTVFSKMAGVDFSRAAKEEYQKRVMRVRRLEKLGAQRGTLKVDAIPAAMSEQKGQ